MPGDEMKMIIEMAKDIAGIKSLLGTMVNTNTMAVEAQQSARSAHHRIEEMKREHDEELKEMRAGQRWLIGSTISVVGLFLAAVGFLWKLTGS